MQVVALLIRRCITNPQAGRRIPKLKLVPMPPDECQKPTVPENKFSSSQRAFALQDPSSTSLQFKRWLALFFIGKGNYKITDKGYEELAPQVVRQNLEFGEPVSDRTREPRLEERRSLTKKEIRDAVSSKVEQMLEKGKAEELCHKGYVVRSYHVGWDDKEIRSTVIKKLLGFLGASPARLDELKEELDQLILQSAREEKTDAKRMQEVLDELRKNLERIRRISVEDFVNNGLGGVLANYCSSSPYLALVEVGYAYSLDEVKEHTRTGFKTDKIYPWVMSKAPSIYDDYEIRIAATKWLLWKLNKDAREITKDDFESRLGGLLSRPEYKGSPYKALFEAGYAYSLDETLVHATNNEFKTDKVYAWEMKKTPHIYEEKEIRIAACKWLIWRLKKEVKEITADDFYNNKLDGLLERYKGSPYLALVEAEYAYSLDETKEHARTGQFGSDKIYHWEMVKVGNEFYKDKQIRIAATKWLIWKLKKEAREITQDDFYNNGLTGLLTHHYKNSPYEALLKAGLVTPEDETYIRSSQHTH
ncbi:hypothetical protein J4450_06200 [Candidatus Micrarchaeota archaeon]|nr:hypothetical protein [Candidatus Micrarchaeota archaeon]